MSRFDLDLEQVRYDDAGLVPVVLQDVATGAVLMVAWADRAALERTLETGEAHFFSRSRQRMWRKGETSGNVMRVREARLDCDSDTLLLGVEPAGPACHEGTRTCFESNPAELELGWLARVIDDRRGSDPESSYSARLLAAGVDRIGRKIGEEATETVIAALRTDQGGERSELIAESADLLYHLVVLLRALDVDLEEVARELERRHRGSAAEEVS